MSRDITVFSKKKSVLHSKCFTILVGKFSLPDNEKYFAGLGFK
jgi:hypothetical protein